MIKVKESYLHEGLLKLGEFKESSDNPRQKLLAPGVQEGVMLKNDFHMKWSQEHMAGKIRITNTLPPRKSVVTQIPSQPISSKYSACASQPASRTTTNKRKMQNSDLKSEGESAEMPPSGRPVRSSLKCDTCHKSFCSAGRLMTHYDKSVTCSINK